MPTAPVRHRDVEPWLPNVESRLLVAPGVGISIPKITETQTQT